MSKIKAFENLPDIEVEGAETLEEAIEDCKALYAKFDKELDGTESTPLARCNEARLVLLTLAHRSHHTIEYATNALKAELLPTSTGANLTTSFLSWERNACRLDMPPRCCGSRWPLPGRVQRSSRKERKPGRQTNGISSRASMRRFRLVS